VRTQRGFATLFVDGFGLEIESERLEGTGLKSGDSVGHDITEQLDRFHAKRRIANSMKHIPRDTYRVP
jgi:hypothetical protein